MFPRFWISTLNTVSFTGHPLPAEFKINSLVWHTWSSIIQVLFAVPHHCTHPLLKLYTITFSMCLPASAHMFPSMSSPVNSPDCTTHSESSAKYYILMGAFLYSPPTPTLGICLSKNFSHSSEYHWSAPLYPPRVKQLLGKGNIVLFCVSPNPITSHYWYTWC